MPWNPTEQEIISNIHVGFDCGILIFNTVNAYSFKKQLEVLKYISETCQFYKNSYQKNKNLRVSNHGCSWLKSW